LTLYSLSLSIDYMKGNMKDKPTSFAKAKRLFNRKNGINHKSENRSWLKKSADIASKILDALDNLSITQIELANRLNVSRQHVSKIVKGQENLTLETIAKIEKVLGVTLIQVPKKEMDYSVREQRITSLKRLSKQAQKLRLGYEAQDKIKPIVYHSFEEKERLEKELMAAIPSEKRKAIARSLMSIFHAPRNQRKKPSRKLPTKK
jgi:transcriptional regulator with XRE-family HTH domain